MSLLGIEMLSQIKGSRESAKYYFQSFAVLQSGGRLAYCDFDFRISTLITYQ